MNFRTTCTDVQFKAYYHQNTRLGKLSTKSKPGRRRRTYLPAFPNPSPLVTDQGKEAFSATQIPSPYSGQQPPSQALPMRALICGAARMRAGSVLRREADKAAPHDGEKRRPAPSPPAMATIFTGFSPLARGVEPNTLWAHDGRSQGE